MRLRKAHAHEVAQICAIEDDAGRLYAEAGLPADLPGMDSEMVRASVHDERVSVLVTPTNTPVAFALWWSYPEALHLRELGVHPHYMRRGLGRRLIDHVVEVARDQQRLQVTLTTFRDVPWNGPYYRRCGFSELPRERWPRWLAEIRTAEAGDGLDRWPRLAMARPLGP